MHVVFSSDDRYVPHMGVAMTSILMNCLESDELCFHILSDSISRESIMKLDALRGIRHFELHVIDIGRAIKKSIRRINTISCNTRITEASYYRLLAGRIFPDLDKVLYLDCDLVVLESLSSIWETDLSDNTLAAVEEIMTPPLHRDTFTKFPRYFNSGVLLFNLSRWRNLGYENKCLDVPQDLLERIEHHDQSILNYIFREGDVHYLGAQYNYMIGFKNKFDPSMDPANKGIQPVIVHYAGSKPWLLDGLLDRKLDMDGFEHYWRYWKQSPWADRSPLGRIEIRDVLKYLYRHPKDTLTAIKRIRELGRDPVFSPPAS